MPPAGKTGAITPAARVLERVHISLPTPFLIGLGTVTASVSWRRAEFMTKHESRQSSWSLLVGAVVLTLASFPLAAQGRTHHFEPTRYYNTFSFAHEPALRIRPGDRVVTRTIDARGDDHTGTRVATGPNPQTGPFYVEGAQPGDVLVVRLEKIEPNRDTAWSSSLLAPYAADPAYLRHEGQRKQEIMTWHVDRVGRVASVTAAGIRPGAIQVPLAPMLGCVAVAPPHQEAISTSTPGEFGGNMDYNKTVAGVTLMLPVFEPGALLFVGDGHARQGEGEVVGNALEISMDVEFSVDLIKHRKIRWPRMETDDAILVMGSARPLLQALQHATTELQRWLMEEHGFNERGASLLMGHALEYEIANVVDPHFTVVARLPKSFLPR